MSLFARLPARLREQALTHGAFAPRAADSYERLEFLGDSALGLAVTTDLFHRFADLPEGRLTQIRSQVVSGTVCAEVADTLGLGDRFAALARARGLPAPEVESLASNRKVLAALTEAVIGAVFLHAGRADTELAVREAFGAHIASAATTTADAKSALQERLARQGDQIAYVVVGQEGPGHQRVFAVEARASGRTLGVGRAPSKKAAEQIAAAAALEALVPVPLAVVGDEP